MKVTKLVAMFALLALTAVGCIAPTAHNLPPASRLLERGPGVAGPGPGVLPPPGVDGRSPAPPSYPESQLGAGGHNCPTCSPSGTQVTQVGYGGPAMSNQRMVMQRTVQVLFAAPESMQVRWGSIGSRPTPNYRFLYFLLTITFVLRFLRKK